MKNEHIKNLKAEVPREIRLEVYKELLERIKKKQTLEGDRHQLFQMCIYLPVILWGFGDVRGDTGPDGSYWDYEDTVYAFPELTQDVIDSIENVKLSIRNAVRAEYLREWIKQLEN